MPKPVLILWSNWIKFFSFFLIIYGLAMVFVPYVMRNPIAIILYGNNESLRSVFVSTPVAKLRLTVCAYVVYPVQFANGSNQPA